MVWDLMDVIRMYDGVRARSGWMRRCTVVMVVIALPCVTFRASEARAQASATQIGVVKYRGGGDWYQGQTPLPNLIRYVREHTLIDLAPQPEVVELTSDKLFSHPFLFMSGHGNVVLDDDEVSRLRRYLQGGGFLYIDDDYGLDSYIRREMKKVFPESDFVELPFDHDLYHTHFDFNHLPKIHEHDNKPPQGFGLFVDGRLAVFYTVETNISDGWESPEVHNNPPEKREQALQFGTNVVAYALTH